jgi:hypothetical protein
MPIDTNSVLIFKSLDSDVIILRGVESEAASQLLKGVVVLCLPAALKVEDVHLRMTGHLKLGFALSQIPPEVKQSANRWSQMD